MRSVFLTALLALFAVSASPVRGGDFATATLDATFKLFHKDSTAACVLIRRDRSPEDASLYLATAAHVLERTKGETAILVLREQRDDGSYVRRDHTIAVRQGDEPLWVKHPTEDAAVLRLAENLPVPVAPLPASALADEASLRDAGLHICSPIFALSYPQRFEANEAGFAVARQGIIASHPFLPIERHHTFLADLTAFSGDSGGPVFVEGKNGHPLLIGMALAQYRHDERITTEFEERTVHVPLGLSMVLHAQFVRETIETASKAASSK